MTIRVLLIDDSAAARQLITQALASAADIRLQTTPTLPAIALEAIRKERPDVVVLDINQPHMDPLTYLRRIMSERPTPVVICADLDSRNARAHTLEAMSAGAAAVIPKPTGTSHQALRELGQRLTQAIRDAKLLGLGQLRRLNNTGAASSTAAVLANTMLERQSAPRLTADTMLPAPRGVAAQNILKTVDQVVVIGISTGGTQALEKLLPKLPLNCPGLAIVQHMPETLTGAFATRLNNLSRIAVREARDGDQIRPGQALIAPGGKHLLIHRNGTHYFVRVKDGPLVNRHRPSVDVLFRSAAVSAGINAIGIIMTGMGDDGAHGLKEMHVCGAHTIAQDEASCTVFGMPKEAIRMGAAKETLSLDQIALKLIKLAH
jgi:two-component system chemotaxis response regulator CheB